VSFAGFRASACRGFQLIADSVYRVAGTAMDRKSDRIAHQVTYQAVIGIT